MTTTMLERPVPAAGSAMPSGPEELVQDSFVAMHARWRLVLRYYLDLSALRFQWEDAS